MGKIITISIAIILLLFFMTLVVGCQEEPSPQPVPAPLLPSDNETVPTPADPAPALTPESAPAPPVLESVPTPAPEPLESVRVAPVEVAAGETKQLEAIATDQHGNRLTEVIVAWTISDENAGSITQAGIFTAGETAGTFSDAVEVEVRQGEVTRKAMTTVTVTPGPLEQVVMAPNQAEIGMEMTQQFVAVGADRYGNRISDLDFSWSVENGGGTIDGTGLFTAGATSGNYTDTAKAEATQGNVTRFATANVTVEPDRILFVSGESMGTVIQRRIYIMDADGSNMKRLMSIRAKEFRLSYSPDGQRIVYGSGGSRGKIMVMNIDGSGNLCLSGDDTKTDNRDPAWSPDGTRVVFSSYNDKEEDSDIYVVDADGGNLTQLTDTIDYDESGPDWSPDGNRIAFSSYSPEENGWDIYVMDADGDNVTQLTDTMKGPKYIIPERHLSDPDWSPDGTRIMFSERRTTWSLGPTQLQLLTWVMNADGSNQKQLIFNAGYTIWSPDSTQIAFSYNESIGYKGRGIYVMDADGTNRRKLTSDLPLFLWFGEIAWSPDGSKITFVSKEYTFVLSYDPLTGLVTTTKQHEIDDLYVMDADGKNKICLTDNSKRVIMCPQWVPRKRGIEVNEDSVIILDAQGVIP